MKYIITENQLRKVILEQSSDQSTDIWKMCLGFLYRNNVQDKDPNILKYKGDVMRYCQAKRDGKEPDKLSPESKAMLETVLNTIYQSTEKEFYKKEGENVKL